MLKTFSRDAILNKNALKLPFLLHKKVNFNFIMSNSKKLNHAKTKSANVCIFSYPNSFQS